VLRRLIASHQCSASCSPPPSISGLPEIGFLLRKLVTPDATGSPPHKGEGTSGATSKGSGVDSLPLRSGRSGSQDRQNGTLRSRHVMAGPVPAIPIRKPQRPQERDARHKAGHDREGVSPAQSAGSATRPLSRVGEGRSRERDGVRVGRFKVKRSRLRAPPLCSSRRGPFLTRLLRSLPLALGRGRAAVAALRLCDEAADPFAGWHPASDAQVFRASRKDGEMTSPSVCRAIEAQPNRFRLAARAGLRHDPAAS
jgi:hypothetical protein